MLNKQEIHDIFIKTNKIKLVFKYLTKRTDSNEILRDKAFNITKNSKYDGYQRGTASMVWKFLIKKLQTEQLKMEIFLTKN